jgi:hypothetical protein
MPKPGCNSDLMGGSMAEAGGNVKPTAIANSVFVADGVLPGYHKDAVWVS